MFKITKANKKSILLWSGIAIASFVSLAILSYSLTNSSINKKEDQLIELASEINNIAGEMSVSDQANQFSLNDIDTSLYSLTKLDRLANSDYKYLSPNLIESVMHKSKSNELLKQLEFFDASLSDISNSATSISSRINTLRAFLNYSPQEDFKQFGQDVAQDEERIDVTKQAFSNLALDKSLNNTDLQAIQLALKSLESIDNSDLAAYFNQVGEAQSAILLALKTDSKALVTDVNNLYNYILYQ